jgi:hypothetical protein
VANPPQWVADHPKACTAATPRGPHHVPLGLVRPPQVRIMVGIKKSKNQMGGQPPTACTRGGRATPREPRRGLSGGGAATPDKNRGGLATLESHQGWSWPPPKALGVVAQPPEGHASGLARPSRGGRPPTGVDGHPFVFSFNLFFFFMSERKK